ncbi:hypothetical protein RRG08_038564 [Elysia crispata]|uniref:Uncharacterized protein n=1 Tax=Elysia crispata TaxID=231223 RepID=A0AAE0YG23_9GAST|nr:hypothetical protein RRG08_038564 [Elysia crispata]
MGGSVEDVGEEKCRKTTTKLWTARTESQRRERFLVFIGIRLNVASQLGDTGRRQQFLQPFSVVARCCYLCAPVNKLCNYPRMEAGPRVETVRDGARWCEMVRDDACSLIIIREF